VGLMISAGAVIAEMGCALRKGMIDECSSRWCGMWRVGREI
jgi:hypothetical protein